LASAAPWRFAYLNGIAARLAAEVLVHASWVCSRAEPRASTRTWLAAALLCVAACRGSVAPTGQSDAAIVKDAASAAPSPDAGDTEPEPAGGSDDASGPAPARDAAAAGNEAGATANDAAAPVRDAGGDAQASASGVTQAAVFFFGHSLVDQDMPLMVGSLATARSKTYSAKGQLGWGTALDAHWSWNGEWSGAPLGFEDENKGRSFFAGEGKAQLARGVYDVMVMTESNGHTHGNGDSTVDYATRLVRHARMAKADTRVFLYSSWLDRSEFGSLSEWQTRTEADVAWWERVADRVNAAVDGPDIRVIPGAAILAKVTRAVAEGKITGLAVDDLFRPDDGVHVNDLGFYVIALAHYAAIFRDTPVGLPVATQTEDGPAETLSAAAAASIQRIVWDYLQGYPRAGIAP
jgi:hypothetical protein